MYWAQITTKSPDSSTGLSDPKASVQYGCLKQFQQQVLPGGTPCQKLPSHRWHTWHWPGDCRRLSKLWSSSKHRQPSQPCADRHAHVIFNPQLPSGFHLCTQCSRCGCHGARAQRQGPHGLCECHAGCSAPTRPSAGHSISCIQSPQYLQYPTGLIYPVDMTPWTYMLTQTEVNVTLLLFSSLFTLFFMAGLCCGHCTT